jgi:hypothetical protein
MISAGNYTFTFDSYNATALCDKADLEEVVAELEATFGDATATASEPGLKTFKITASGAWAKALDAKLRGTGKKTAVLTIGSGAEQVSYTWTTQAFVTNYKRTMGAKDRIDWSATFNLSGLPTVA